MAIRHTIINGTQKVWLARVAFQGRRRAKVCRTKEEARHGEGELLRDLKAEAAKEAETGARPATLRRLLEFYVEDLEARGKGPDTVGRAVETAHVIELLMPELLDRPVSRIGESELFAFRRARVERSAVAMRLTAEARELRAAGQGTKAEAKEQAAQAAQRAGTKASTINRDLRTLRAALKRARPDFRFPPATFLPEDETRVRWLRPDEELLLEAALRPPFRAIAKLAGLTLMRLSEIRTLERSAVHLEQGVVMLPRAKSGARPVILSAEAQKILRGQLEGHDGEYVFPGPGGQPFERSYVGRVFRRAARSAGLRDFHFHDLRHHGATMALNRGFTAPIVMALGGWKTERMMRRYAAVTDQTLRAAAEAVSGAALVPVDLKPAPAVARA
jgi:integrase